MREEQEREGRKKRRKNRKDQKDGINKMGISLETWSKRPFHFLFGVCVY